MPFNSLKHKLLYLGFTQKVDLILLFFFLEKKEKLLYL